MGASIAKYFSYVQFFQDWMLAVVVLIMVIVDLLVLVVFSAVVGGLNLQIVERVIHRENPQTVEGVSSYSLRIIYL